MADTADDLDFLAQLARRGHVPEALARDLAVRARAGEDLDDLLVAEAGLEPERVDELRRTNGGEIPQIPGLTIGGRLGRGGTADVWRARDRKAGRDIALKVLLPEARRDAAVAKAFVREARLLESLDHPGLVRCYGAAKSGTTVFTRLELIDGPSLQDELDRGRVFEEAEALGLVLDVARALGYLESQGLVHRDVKPGNVLLAPDGRAVLIDLGFAALAGEARSDGRDDVATGTVAYLSPEQAVGGAGADIRSDVYSLGVSLFQLVIGRLPFEADDDREVLAMQVLQSLESPELKRRGVSPHLHYLVQKMMSKDPGERYQSWPALVGDIEALVAGSRGLDWRGGTPPSGPLAGAAGRVRPRRRRRP
ncbi:Serine/threonine-protein kinase PknB [Planctomycetes bacterium Pla163]|uniref:Serine/threonine-protein kinase PknB n=1 Tax=Rohdeia mirabilis TaxID=2528008 RepID=A0A518CXB5_9BACT|nr:Serine/threonine-protein kinase PknB [Planctomycetes bacterium Pla163]